jgi:hypothetical protein
MPDVPEQLDAMQRRIAQCNDVDTPAEYLQYAAVTRTGDLFHIDYYGSPFEDGYLDLLETLGRAEVAAALGSLTLRSPDEGANGTRNFDLEPLLAAGSVFPRLESFRLPLNQPGDHNRTVVGRDFDEDGVLARLLAAAPALLELIVPSAPNAAFFDVGRRPLRFLSIDAGYATQDFILNLSESSCFPDLSCLEWGEYNETYLEDFANGCTPLEHYHRLFATPAFAGVQRFIWRNPACASDAIQALKALKPDLQLLVVRNSAEYA